MEGNRYMEKKLFVPGRTELAGNHTDHQQGRILASAVDLGLYADFEKNGENAIHIHSEGYSDFTVRLNHTAVRTGEFGTPKSLVRGMTRPSANLVWTAAASTPRSERRCPRVLV